MNTERVTRNILKAMLTENTGVALCDSGGAYGRHWERNQDRDFDQEPASTIEFYMLDDNTGYVDISHNVYHWLAERVSYDPEEQARWTEFSTQEKYDSTGWLDIIRDYADEYYDGECHIINTYNGEDMVSQVLQYAILGDLYNEKILLQIHNGCDVRGGYTAPVAFITDECGLMDNANATIQPEYVDTRQIPIPGVDPGYDPYWQTDDGGHFYRDGATGYTRLEEYEWTRNPDERGQGKLYVDDEGQGYCPITGRLLKVYF